MKYEYFMRTMADEQREERERQRRTTHTSDQKDDGGPMSNTESETRRKGQKRVAEI